MYGCVFAWMWGGYMRGYVCVDMCVCALCMCVYACTWMHGCVCMCVCLGVFAWMCLHMPYGVCICVFACVCVHTCTFSINVMPLAGCMSLSGDSRLSAFDYTQSSPKPLWTNPNQLGSHQSQAWGCQMWVFADVSEDGRNPGGQIKA